MKNVEKYLPEILTRIAMNGDVIMNNPNTAQVNRAVVETQIAHGMEPAHNIWFVLRWLFEEYVQPTLKDGCDLKPGQVIEVQNAKGEWLRRQFVCYHLGAFYVTGDEAFGEGAENANTMAFHAYAKARLPER